MDVEVNITELMTVALSVLTKPISFSEEPSPSQICGLKPREYARVILDTKFEMLQILPTISQQIGSIHLLKLIVQLPKAIKTLLTEVQQEHRAHMPRLV